MNKRESFDECADFVVDLSADGLPDLAVRRAVDGIIDCLGCAYAGSREALAPMLRRVITLAAPSDPRAAPLLGTRDAASATDAALYNGTLSHALDFDDITHPAYSHPSAVLVPVILSLANASGASGRDAVAAYVIGLELFGKLGRTLNTAHYRRGWHATSTFGSLAAAAAAARLLRLDRTQTRHALSIAGSASSGLRANFGTMTKPLHCGYAARNGVLAAQLAAEGFTAAHDILGQAFGFAKTFNDGAEIRWDALRGWGHDLEILSEFGLALKPYPSCGATHPAIEAALLLRDTIGGRHDAIESVRVGVPDMAFQPLIYVKPASPLQGKFSMHYVVAAALRDGAVNLKSFTDEKLADPEIAALLGRVTMEVDERVADNSEFGAVVSVRLRDGTSHELTVPLAIGKPDRWFSREQLRTKFVDCASMVLTPQHSEGLFAQLLELPARKNLAAILQALRP